MQSRLLPALALALGLLVAGSPAGVYAQAARANAIPAIHEQRTGVAVSSDARIHYDVWGDLHSGVTPLLVLHGAYMSADAMTPFVERFARTRPVIVLDQRGHGRTGDAPGPLTYESMADDAVAVLDALKVEKADVFGYSMGGFAGLQLAIRHPARVSKLTAVSVGTRLDAWYPEVLAGVAQMSPEMFDNTPIRRAYDRLAPRPQDFPILVEEIKALDALPYNWDAAIGELTHPTMIVAGDYDVFRPEHAVDIFRMRGGGDAAAAAQGVLTSPPPARLLILPATTHLGIMAAAEQITASVTPFLDDETPPLPPGFFQ